MSTFFFSDNDIFMSERQMEVLCPHLGRLVINMLEYMQQRMAHSIPVF